MDLELKNKVAIVTGASRGIGQAICEALAAEGMNLVLAARTSSDLESVAKSLNTSCLIQAVDLRDPAVPKQIISAAIDRFGRIDALVNNAGATKRGDFLTFDDTDWHDGFALKFFGAMRMCRSAWPHLQASQGCIVNIVGIGGRTGSSEFTIGGSVNAALLNLTKALADRGVHDQIRVNAINPGSIATDRLKSRIRKLAQDQGLDESTAAQQMAKTSKISRFGLPAEIANAVAFLISPHASYCQGAIIDIDGGQTRTL